MFKLLPVLALLGLFGFKAEPEPLFKSPRKFYRAGDTIQVAIERDTAIDIGICVQQGRATPNYRIDKWEADRWESVYRSQDICNASLPTAMQVGKGYTVKHFLLDQGTFRVVVSDRYYSSKFEVR